MGCSDTAVNYLASTKGNGNSYTSAIMINTTNTFYGYSLGFIAFPTILSSLLLLMSLYPIAQYGLWNNHQKQQWCAINLVFMTCISLLLPTSASSTKLLRGKLDMLVQNMVQNMPIHMWY
jgi:hypothetical protein